MHEVINILLPLCHQQKGEVALAILKDMQFFCNMKLDFHHNVARFLSSIMAIQHLLLVQDCTLLFFACSH